MVHKTMHCSNFFKKKLSKTKGISLVIPIATAVSCESPVIIFIDTPEAMSVVTASFTPVLGGSMIPTRPRNVSCPSSGPEAKARTQEIIIKSKKENVSHKDNRIYLTKARDSNTAQINHLSLQCHCSYYIIFKNQSCYVVRHYSLMVLDTRLL